MLSHEAISIQIIISNYLNSVWKKTHKKFKTIKIGTLSDCICKKSDSLFWDISTTKSFFLSRVHPCGALEGQNAMQVGPLERCRKGRPARTQQKAVPPVGWSLGKTGLLLPGPAWKELGTTRKKLNQLTVNSSSYVHQRRASHRANRCYKCWGDRGRQNHNWPDQKPTSRRLKNQAQVGNLNFNWWISEDSRNSGVFWDSRLGVTKSDS